MQSFALVRDVFPSFWDEDQLIRSSSYWRIVQFNTGVKDRLRYLQGLLNFGEYNIIRTEGFIRIKAVDVILNRGIFNGWCSVAEIDKCDTRTKLPLKPSQTSRD